MCGICDLPGGRAREYLSHLRGLIDAHGWAVQGSSATVSTRRGRTRPGLPPSAAELVVTGMPVRRAGVLNDIAAHVIHAEPPRPGEQVRLADGPLIEIVRVAEPTAHLLTAVELYGPRIRALQVVHADDAGQWPWDRGYRGVRGGQPVLGPRARRPAGRRRSA